PVFNILVWQLSGNGNHIRMITIGHRGAGGLAPENTLAAIDSGLSYHPDWVEIDIRQTLDSQVVVMHDKSVGRTTSGSGSISKLTYAEIEKFNASVSMDGYAIETKVPLLKEVLLRIKASGTKLLIEIKDPELYPGMVGRLAAAILETGTKDEVMISSFSKEGLTKIKELLPSVKTCLL